MRRLIRSVMAAEKTIQPVIVTPINGLPIAFLYILKINESI
jgi:hypothetical protein